MKIIITENQLKSLIENILIEQQDKNRTLELLKKKGPMDEWFYENIVKKVKEKIYPEYPNSIYYVDKNTNEPYSIYYVDKNTNEPYMTYFSETKGLWVNHKRIWEYFEFNYSYNNMEIQQLIRDLMEEHYGLNITKIL